MSTSPLATMSSNRDKPYNYKHSLSLHRRSNSDELDVFEVARYSSNINEEDKRNCMIGISNITHHLNTVIESDRCCRVQNNNKPGRLSLDLPKIRLLSSNNNISIISPREFYAIDDHQKRKECSKDDQSKKYKQPSSPGAKLASFLNSLFNQATRSKKKKTKLKNQDLEEDQQNPSGGTRRKRSSSISHFGITRKDSVNDCNILNSKLSVKPYSSGSGFIKTPPPVYAETATKCYKECVKFSDNYHHHKHVISLPMGGGQHGIKSKQTSDNKSYNNGKTDLETRNLELSDRDLSESHWGTTDHDDGADSDSSSDLFDLPNIHESIFYSSSGLPVYESTHMQKESRTSMQLHQFPGL